MKALVLGATGRIGNAIVRELLNQGAAVSAVSRRVQPPENLIDLDLDYRSGDANRPGQIESWVAGHELVVDAAAPYHLWLFQDAPSAARLASAERQLSALLESVARHNCAFALVGSQATDDRQRPMLGRAQARILRLLHPYFELKRRMESKIRRAMRDGLRAVIVSPTFCIGPGDISDPDLAFIPMTVNGALPATNSHALNVMDVRDVAALLAAAVAKSAFGSTIPVVAAAHSELIAGDAHLRRYLRRALLGATPTGKTLFAKIVKLVVGQLSRYGDQKILPRGSRLAWLAAEIVAINLAGVLFEPMLAQTLGEDPFDPRVVAWRTRANRRFIVGALKEYVPSKS